MDFSAPMDEDRDSKRFTLADYDYEHNSSDASSARMAPLGHDHRQDGTLDAAGPSRGQSSIPLTTTTSPGSLRLHNESRMPSRSPIGSSALDDHYRQSYQIPLSALPSSSRPAHHQYQYQDPHQDTFLQNPHSLPRSFASTPSFPKQNPQEPYSDLAPLPHSRSHGYNRRFPNPQTRLDPQSSLGAGSSLTPYQQPLDPISPSLTSHTISAQRNTMDSLEPLPSISRSYSSGRSMQFALDDADNASTHDINEKRDRPPVSRGPTSRRVTGIPWYKQIIPSTTSCRLLLLTIIVELIINLTIEANILWRFNEEVKSGASTELELENKRRLPIYLILYGLAYLWELVLTVLAIRTRNTVQVIAITLFNFAVLGFAVIQIYELRSILGDNLAEQLPGGDSVNAGAGGRTLLSLPLNVLTAVVIAVVATGSVVLVVLAYFVRRDFGWERYRFLGADLQIRKFYFRFQVFECVCYFGAFFCLGFGIQFIWLVLQKTDVEYIITWVVFPLSILLLIMGRFAAKYENPYLMGPFLVGLLGGCGYFIFKLIRIWQMADTTYANVTASLTTFDALSILSLGACFVGGAVVWHDFGKGLKEALLNQPKVSSLPSLAGFWRSKSHEAESEAIDMEPRRISII